MRRRHLSLLVVLALTTTGLLGSSAVAGPQASSVVVAARDGDDEPWSMPAEGPVAQFFVAPATRWGPGHRGLDLAAGVGTAVVAPRSGVVTFVGPVAGRGVLTILHPDGLRSSLEPVTASVTAGMRVGRGSVVGVVSGEAAHCPGCLHWGVRSGTAYLDPWTLFPREPVVLLARRLSPGPPPGGRCAGGASLPCASGRSATR